MLDKIIPWIIVGILLFSLIYTLFVIKNEKVSFKEESRAYSFKFYTLFVPHWWTKTKEENNFIKFERTDTRYDWYCIFHWVEKNQNVEQILEEWIKHKKIEFDPDRKIQTEANHLIKDETLTKHIEKFIRAEGTATENESERLYYDICVIKDQRYGGILIAESRSSVLNGLVEGPFFEEVLKCLEDKS